MSLYDMKDLSSLTCVYIKNNHLHEMKRRVIMLEKKLVVDPGELAAVNAQQGVEKFRQRHAHQDFVLRVLAVPVLL